MNLPTNIINNTLKANSQLVFKVKPICKQQKEYTSEYSAYRLSNDKKIAKELIDYIILKKFTKPVIRTTDLPKEQKQSYFCPNFFNPFHVRERRIQKCIEFFDNKMGNLNYE